MIIDEKQLIQAVNTSLSRKECFEKLGLHTKSNNSYRIFNYYVSLYNIDISNLTSSYTKCSKPTEKIALDDVFNGKYPLYSIKALKKKIIKNKIFEYCCSVCCLSEWLEKPIPLDLDHINGCSTDHRLINLRLICRNCHAQTDTFCGRNIKSNKLKQQLKNNKKEMKKYIIDERINIILSSDVDFTKFGWVGEIAKILNISHSKVTPWMIRHMSDFYHTSCYRRNMAGVHGIEPR